LNKLPYVNENQLEQSIIFEEKELDRDTTVSKMEIVVSRGFRGEIMEQIEFYSLDASSSLPLPKQAPTHNRYATQDLIKQR